MQATPQDIPGGIPNGRDTAETHAHPGQMLDREAAEAGGGAKSGR